VRNLLGDVPSPNRKAYLDLDDPESMVSKFLRCYRQEYGRGTISASLIDVA